MELNIEIIGLLLLVAAIGSHISNAFAICPLILTGDCLAPTRSGLGACAVRFLWQQLS
jgi:hypothetical protein